MQASLNGRASGPMVPPHNLEAERAVLGAMMVSEPAVSVVTEVLREGDFYSEVHRQVYRAIHDLHGKGEPVDMVTVQSALDQDADRGFVFEMIDSMPNAANAHQYARLVKDASQLRRLIDAGSRVQHFAMNAEGREVDEVVDQAEQVVYEVSDRDENHQSGLVHPRDGAHDALKRLVEAQQRDNAMTGLSTGFADIDDMTLGYDPGDLTVLAARPAMGKTALALNKCWHVSRNLGMPTAIFSLEMSKEQLYDRLIASEAQVSLQALQGGSLTPEEGLRATHAAERLAKTPIYIDDSGTTSVSSMRARIRRLNSRLRVNGQEIAMVAVDYIQLMSTPKQHDSLYHQVTEISRGLKLLARDLEIPVLALAQLSREVEKREDKRPRLSDLRDSGAIEQDADRVEFLYRDEYYDPESDDKGIAEFIMGKQRNGPTGVVKLAFIGSQTRFASLAKGV